MITQKEDTYIATKYKNSLVVVVECVHTLKGNRDIFFLDVHHIINKNNVRLITS
jgi:hypothetical protein